MRYDDQYEQAGRAFAALAEPLRLRILALLGSGERRVKDLVAETGASQPLVSFHLRALREAGLVSRRRRGRESRYALEPDALARLERRLAHLRQPPELWASRVCV